MTTRRDREEFEELSNSLFGAPEELSLEDVLETLKWADIDSEALCERAYYRLLLKARDYRTRQEEIPARLRKAIEDLRPASAKPRSQDELDRAASATLSKLLDAVRGQGISSVDSLTSRLPTGARSGRVLQRSINNQRSRKGIVEGFVR